jgi:4-amino-4-deoxy-L-arabinose transferase-like glycosyltransferase
MNTSPRFIKVLLVVFMLIVYIGGLFVPIMNNNAAHHANIALHMYLTGDYVNLIDRGQDYLDKPHLLFWTAALAYHMLGVTSFAYKFFSFLFVIVGIYSTYRMGKLLVDRKTGIYAALILSSSLAFILSTNDVRMDAMVVSCIAFSTWQLLEYFFNHQRTALFLGALGLALGFATKGAVAIVLPVMVVAFYFVQQQKPKAVFTLRWLPLILLTVLFLLPVFYCFYLQFDLHPEKVVRGTQGNSGILFLLFGQSFQRLTGTGWGERASDPFFLLHTFLWAFLPWCVLAYVALFKNIRDWFRVKFQFNESTEVALTATLIIVFTLISFSRFKNAHYVNVLFPYFAVLTARYITTAGPKTIRSVFGLQLVISVLLMITVIALNLWAFPFNHAYVVLGAILVVALFLLLVVNKTIALSTKTVWLSFGAMAFTYLILNFNFYPQLLPYQSGHGLAKRIKEAGIDPQKIYYIDDENERNYSMEFSLQTLLPTIRIDSLKKLHDSIYLFAHTSQLESLRQQQVPFDTIIQASHYNVTTLKGSFLNPATRAQKLLPHYIIRVDAH